MTFLRSLVFLLGASLPVIAQETAQNLTWLTLATDHAARVEIDGKDAGTLQSGATLRIQATPGDHIILATPEGGGPVWRKSVVISSALPNSVSIPLRAHLQRAEIQKAGFWEDHRTGLIWAASDNGSGVTVSQAHAYCQQLTSGGFHDWRLPAISELQTVFGGAADERGFRVVAPLKLTGWAWSSTSGNEPAENWALDLGDGARASIAAGDAGLNRALCVRSTQPTR